MKILFLIGSLSNSGGMERVLTFQANYFADKLGYDVSILTYEKSDKPDFFPLSTKVKRIFISPLRETHRNKFINLYLFKKYLKLLKKDIEQLLFEDSFDICLSFGLEGNFLCSINDKSKKIVEFHFSKDFYKQDSGTFVQRIWRNYRFKKSVYKTAKYSKMVVLTETDRSFWKKYLDNVVAINNPNVIETATKSTLENKIAISLGRLTQQKGFDRLIEIWDLLPKNNQNWELHIYGKGSEYDNLKSQIARKNLQDRIKIFDPVKDVNAIYEKASIYLMASRFEGFGLVLVEAMSFGLPVISYDVIGPNELINNDYNGYLIENGNKLDFAEKTNLLIESEAKRKELGANSLEFVKKFSPDIIMKQWVQLFEEVLKE